tara:strand:- start:780 stop:1955 length:1176 start_codon:yes stop_codon:yes gene_type:complete
MSCDARWTLVFLYDNIDRKFSTQTFPDHVSNIKFEREKSLFPQTQYFVERINKRSRRNEKMIQIDKRIQELNERIRKLVQKKYELKQKNFREKAEDSGKKRIVQKVVKFIGHCPNDDCKGFLNEKFKCPLCKVKVCKKCRAKKHYSECKKDDVDTAKLLSDNTKPCPSCKVPIFKISGCMQMYCTTCHTAFDWKTMKIEKGRIHNPHYYEWMRKNGNEHREIGDVPCGGLIQFNRLVRWTRTFEIKTRNYYHDIHRCISHFRDVVIPRYPITEEKHVDNRQLRISYMMGDIDDVKFKRKLKSKTKINERNREVNMVLTMFCNTMEDLFRQIIQCKVENIPEITQTMQKLRKYTNKNLKKIYYRFKIKVPLIKEETYFTNNTVQKVWCESSC